MQSYLMLVTDIDQKQVARVCERAFDAKAQPGLCLHCTSEPENVPPNAVDAPCPSCDRPAVAGTRQLIKRFYY